MSFHYDRLVGLGWVRDKTLPQPTNQQRTTTDDGRRPRRTTVNGQLSICCQWMVKDWVPDSGHIGIPLEQDKDRIVSNIRGVEFTQKITPHNEPKTTRGKLDSKSYPSTTRAIHLINGCLHFILCMCVCLIERPINHNFAYGTL
jgi:hypothetical protein